ncbi:MAG: hypothetical protein HOO86_07935 [Bacteroidales bacterium]|nr:hypothetical protein [Bacteroidales bacterium]
MKIIALRIAGSIFGIVAILHLIRIITLADVRIEDWLLPVWFNWMGLFGAIFMSGWLWWLTFTKSAIH